MIEFEGSDSTPSLDIEPNSDESRRRSILKTLGYGRTPDEIVRGRPSMWWTRSFNDQEFDTVKYDLYYDGEYVAPLEVTPFDDIFKNQVDVRYSPLDEFQETQDLGWFPFLFYDKPWSESLHPVKRILKYSDLKPEEKDLSGNLSGMIMATGLTNLDRVPNTVSFALTKLQLPNKKISDLSLLSKYKYLQYIDVSHNLIEDLTQLRFVMYLMVLDASFNKISTFSVDPPPWFLTYVNLSFNEFVEIPDFTPFWSIKHLNLSNNKLTEINEGLRKLKYLRYLNLSHNKIEVVQNLFGIPLLELDLSHNQIVGETQDVTHTEDFKHFKTLITLENLNLDSNKLQRLDFISTARMKKLDVSNNLLSTIQAVNDIGKMVELKELFIYNNEIMNTPDIYRQLAFLCPKIEKINKEKIGYQERINAKCMFGDDLVHEAIKNHGYSLLFNHIEPPQLGEDLIEVNDNPNVLALVGPPGSGIETLINELSNKYEQYVRVLKLHRAPVNEMKPKKRDTFVNYVPNSKSRSIFNPRLEKSEFYRHEMKQRRKTSPIDDIRKFQSVLQMSEDEDETSPESNPEYTSLSGTIYDLENVESSLYNFVNSGEFNQLWKDGKFVFVFHSLGNSYGLCFDELEDDGKVCLLGVNLQQAYELKWHGLEPTLLLLMPSSEDVHKMRIEQEIFTKLIALNTAERKSFSPAEVSKRMSKPDESIKNLARLKPRLPATFQYFPEEDDFSTDFSMEISNLKKASITSSAFSGGFSIKDISWFQEMGPAENADIGAKEIENVLKKDPSIDLSLNETLQKIISTRSQYLRAHNNCLFKTSINTDNLEEAGKKVAKIAHEMYCSQELRDDAVMNSVYPLSNHKLYEDLIKPTVDETIDVLKDSEKLEWMDVGEEFAKGIQLFPDEILNKSMSSLTFRSSRESLVMENILASDSSLTSSTC